jgi:hypothetical protein
LNIDPVVLYTPAWKPFFNEDIERAQFPIKIKKSYTISFPRHYLRAVSNFFYLSLIISQIKTLHKLHQFDVIHAHGEIAGLAAVSASKQLNIPSVITIHGIDMCPRMSRGVAKKMFSNMLNQANKIIYVGQPLERHFRSIMNSDRNCCIVHNGFRLPGKQQISQNIFNKDRTIRLISVSNLHEGKGINLTLHALAQLKNQSNNNWFYTIVGSGDQKKYLENLIDQYDLSGQVAFLGDCTHEKVYANLEKSDIFCLPSYREAFGIAYVEAMAHGLLTIGVNGQGPQAFIEHGKTGFLVEPNDIASLLNVLKTAINNFEEMQNIARAGKEYVLSHFTWKKHAEKLLSIYKEVCV